MLDARWLEDEKVVVWRTREEKAFCGLRVIKGRAGVRHKARTLFDILYIGDIIGVIAMRCEDSQQAKINDDTPMRKRSDSPIGELLSNRSSPLHISLVGRCSLISQLYLRSLNPA